MMRACVKPIESMQINFKNEQDVDKFVNWVNGNGKDSKTLTTVKQKFSSFMKAKRG
ncbi:hypothetical protein P4U05_16870 [Bacillus paranthracis]|uniref:hypothetical protein n=1 Tax=Bacillus phage phi4B1 TaxID=1643324 RepID=UPI000200F437|nr:hypothetical protein [Bacillus paranthracis]YP_009206323.1 hypothetical protein XO26_0024 [Bacillus phage phi4B1]ADY20375.1 hypothetical protein YBT020_05645 [Bacillus thuringiensis serovar finitimus YBT-020]MRC72862.1 hypothetical protein [Bacillus thuringiensis]ALF02562.1 hypothetical protein XO26_0024 [Bacillus phage phi4B1]MCR6799349.1 hypothetical protein [Bacillus paranthracis]MEC3358491.1 hypothetical protein [Bacillus paranthracis]